MLKFDLSVTKRAEDGGDSMASAILNVKTSFNGKRYKTEYDATICLHPKCNKCGKYIANSDERLYDSLEHEIVECLVIDILDEDLGEYDREGFDSIMRKWGDVKIYHECIGWNRFVKRQEMIYIPSTGA